MSVKQNVCHLRFNEKDPGPHCSIEQQEHFWKIFFTQTEKITQINSNVDSIKSNLKSILC